MKSALRNHSGTQLPYRPLRVLCLVDWLLTPGYRWLWDYLPDYNDQVDFVSISPPIDRFPGLGKFLGYYQKYFLLALKAFPKMNQYDIVVAWEAKNGLPLALLRKITNNIQTPFVILNFVLKGNLALNSLGLIRYALRAVDKVICVSKKEAEFYPKILKISKNLFFQIPTLRPDYFSNLPPGSGDYIFSAGRSHRDYATLLKAVRCLPTRLVINARPFNLKGLKPPDNVKTNKFLPFNEYLAYIRNARFVILPLYSAMHASGETFILDCMAASKAVIATRTISTEEFIQPGINGFLVEPGDIDTLKQNIQKLLNDPGEAIRMGKNARKMYETNWSFPVIAPKIRHLLHQVVMEKTYP